ncbi:MAG TPA: O-antigen ligase family protein [Prolixibacteraceae bacterium]|nr:O-antigen ligase family protein [Prolixibacteraceae bacterium]
MKEVQQNNNIIPDSWLKYILFYAISLLFIFINAYLVVKKDTLFAVALPVLFAVLLTALYSYDKLIWIAILFAPLSVPLKAITSGLPIDMHLPTEPLIFGTLLLFILSIAQGKRIGTNLTRHPVSIVLYFYLGWMLLTSITSTLPMVSFKYLLSRTWFIVVFFFILAYLFEKEKNIEKFLWMFLIPLVPVMLFTIGRHLSYGLHDNQAAHWVMYPFFKDHTSYGAVLAMCLPFLIGFSFSGWIKQKYKIWIWGLTGFYILAELLSYSRAAWLSLMAAGGVWVVMKLKIKFKTIAITFVSLLLIVFAFQDQILQRLERNSQDSSANLTEHLTSMTNISTDASNLERLNRWHCAIKMFNEKPFFGWGPGTYAMNYAPFQKASMRTIISTNSGDGGNAHSEYLGSMAESGFIGTLSFIAIIIVVLATGINAYSKTSDKRLKMLLISSILSLITYYTHGILNNFLDMDKVSIPFWGFTAIIVAIDLQIKRQKNTRLEEQNG